MSLAVHAAIQQLCPTRHLHDDHHTHTHIAIKWPNDLLWNHKKLAGILIEMTDATQGRTDVIIGIGLNVNAIQTNNTSITTPWCALCDIFKQNIDRNTVLAHLITQLDQHLHIFSKQGFEIYRKQWQARDYLFGRTITLSNPHGQLTGQAQGVDDTGHLLLLDTQGVMHTLSSGDTSLAQKIVQAEKNKPFLNDG